jgi:glycosyltransferase involved in cell wall biosynthesis
MNNDIHNICLLLDSKTYGGIETHVYHLAKGLIASGHNVHIVLISDHGFHPVFDRDEFTRVLTYKPKSGIFSLFSLIKSLNVDVIHTHGYKAGILGRLTSIFHHKAVVSTFHAGEKGNGKIRFYTWLDRLTTFASHTICVSKQIAESIGKDVSIIQNFVEIPKEHSQSSSQGSKIAFVGRFSIEKGPDIFCNIAKNLPALNFTMYGDGPMSAQIEHLKPINVDLIGHVHSMADHWQRIKILCITSREEGLPLVALEALVRGIPVISFDVGGLASVVRNDLTGWLIPPLDEDTFASRVELTCQLSQEKTNQLATTSKNFIRENFSSNAIIPLITECYRAALKDAKYA